jgi:hypothetical protein
MHNEYWFPIMTIYINSCNAAVEKGLIDLNADVSHKVYVGIRMSLNHHGDSFQYGVIPAVIRV